MEKAAAPKSVSTLRAVAVVRAETWDTGKFGWIELARYLEPGQDATFLRLKSIWKIQPWSGQ